MDFQQQLRDRCLWLARGTSPDDPMVTRDVVNDAFRELVRPRRPRKLRALAIGLFLVVFSVPLGVGINIASEHGLTGAALGLMLAGLVGSGAMINEQLRLAE